MGELPVRDLNCMSSSTCLLISNHVSHFLNVVPGSSTDVLLGFSLNINGSHPKTEMKDGESFML